MDKKEEKIPILRIESSGIEYKYPYFFKNKDIGNETFIIQNAKNIPNALFILEIWNKYGYNIGQIERYTPDSIPYTKYLYHSKDHIEKEDINGGSDTFKILIYKKEGKIYTCSMLEYK